MKPPLTDQAILQAIYDRYYDSFAAYSEDDSSRATKNFIPIDIELIANVLGVDKDIVFGRLYYHLQQKYGYKKKDDSNVSFFSLQIKDDRHCVHFPYLASVLANLSEEDKKYQTSKLISAIALVVSIASTVIALLALFLR